ncbi:hypothetical protein MAJHIDBO_02263 [Propionibacterium freudenreichii subsp. shermanii]|nr:hypothetical protein MAJHIDBO_02263 [Propionibacterium freudenreichii subsp. shermanii]SPS10044.1 hypothetical protein MAJHIDBO_02263 [Propionibacterium freudenreichii subsp. shermanii]
MDRSVAQSAPTRSRASRARAASWSSTVLAGAPIVTSSASDPEKVWMSCETSTTAGPRVPGRAPTATSPDELDRVPAISFASVDLPAPDSPITATCSPGAMVRLMSDSTGWSGR